MGTPLFSLRGDTISAYYAPGGEQPMVEDSGDASLCSSVAFATSTCIGGRAISFFREGLNSTLAYTGYKNTPLNGTDGITVAMRLQFPNGTTPAFNNSIFMLGGRTNSLYSNFSVSQQGTGQYVFACRNDIGQNNFSGETITTSLSISSSLTINDGDFHDLVIQWSGLNTGDIQFFMDGVTIGSVNPTRSMADIIDYAWFPIQVGNFVNTRASEFYLNELVLYEHITDASITSAFTGPSRSSFISVSKLQGLNSTDPGVGNVADGTEYIYQGNTQTGTFVFPVSTDPGVGNVAVGTGYTINDTSLTGTLTVPVASSVAADTVPLNNIKENIRYALAVNNTTSGAPVGDLSSGLNRRVRKILKVNPEKIPANDNILPALTVFIDSKDTFPDTIARDAATGKRKAEINIKVAGMVWEPFTSDRVEDPADEDLEKLMENAEKILRGYDTLGGLARWNFPTAITYHSLGWDERAHYRGALMDLKVTLLY